VIGLKDATGDIARAARLRSRAVKPAVAHAQQHFLAILDFGVGYMLRQRPGGTELGEVLQFQKNPCVAACRWAGTQGRRPCARARHKG
jgi:hypothetical protein